MNPFEQLYSTEQLTSFQKVRDALIADPTALDNRGGTVASVTAAMTEEKSDGQA